MVEHSVSSGIWEFVKETSTWEVFTTRTASILLLLLALSSAQASNWEIHLSDDVDDPDEPGGCWAVWPANGFTIQIAETNHTDEDRAKLDLSTHRPVLRWTFNNTREEPPSPRNTEDMPKLEARLYPDGGKGFIELDDKNSHIHLDLWEGYWWDSGTRWMLQWTDFPVERLRTWAVADDPQATANVTLPEVRLILKWTATTIYAHHEYEVERYLDVPLWRTANVVNKLERCSCQMRRRMDSARCWSTDGAS